jgi:SiaC family regulatory phosphoprotein
MNDINISGTQSTPSIQTNWQDGWLEMSGDSYPENSYEVFSPVLAWIDAFLEQKKPLNLKLRLLYLNTSSIKIMMEIFDALQAAFDDSQQVSVEWLYENGNQRVAELAEEFKEDCTFPFEIKSYS